MRSPAAIQATLPYFGSKASVLGDVFAALATALPPERWPTSTFVDPFIGGGSTVVGAKRLGFRVIGGDLAERALIVGRALITNSRTTLTEADELRMQAGDPSNDGRIAATLAPKYFLPAHAEALDRAFSAARTFRDEARRNLALLMLEHACLRVRGFADFSRTGPSEAAAVGDYDRLKLNVGGFKRMVQLTPRTLIQGLRERVNAGVFYNGREGHEVHRADALDLVQAVEGDVLYLDPPYEGSNSYERTYRGLDMILEGRDDDRPTSAFNEKGALDLLDELIRRSAHFGVVVLSFGGGLITGPELLTRVQRQRPLARLAPINLKYRVGTAIYGDSGASREILIVAPRGVA